MIEESLPRNAPAVGEPRVLRGLEAWRKGEVERHGPLFMVRGHGVVLEPEEECDCRDFELRGGPCKHVYAARVEASKARTPEYCEVCGASSHERALLKGSGSWHCVRHDPRFVGGPLPVVEAG